MPRRGENSKRSRSGRIAAWRLCPDGAALHVTPRMQGATWRRGGEALFGEATRVWAGHGLNPEDMDKP